MSTIRTKAILAAIVVTCSLAYVILGHAAQVTAFLGQTGLRFLSRLLGLLLAVIAVQFILQGVEETVLCLLHQLHEGRYGVRKASAFFTSPLVLFPF